MAGCPRRLTKEYGDSLVAKLKAWSRRPSSLIMAQFLSMMDFNRETVAILKSRSPLFADAYNKAMITLEGNLVKGAVNAKGSQNIYLFALKNAHNWRDKHEVEHSGTIGTAAEVIKKIRNAKQGDQDATVTR